MKRTTDTTYVNCIDALPAKDRKLIESMQNIGRAAKLAPGVHTKQIRSHPSRLGMEMEHFYAAMRKDYPDSFRVIDVSTQMTVSASYAYITYEI